MTAANDQFSPSAVHVKVGEAVEIRVTADDKELGIPITTLPPGGGQRRSTRAGNRPGWGLRQVQERNAGRSRLWRESRVPMSLFAANFAVLNTAN